MGDREAMSLVADALYEEHAGRVVLLDDWLGSSRREDLLALLGQRKGRDVGKSGRLEHLEGRAQLTSAAVDEDQVRPARERTGAPRRGFLPAPRRLESLQPSPPHLLGAHHAGGRATD